MPNLSIASQIAFSLAVYEAKALKSKFIDSEQLFLGLLKIEDILTSGREAVHNISESDWQDACTEIQNFKDNFLASGFDPKKARRRLRKIIYESQEEKGEFSGHRTPRCREVFEIAEGLLFQQESYNQIRLRHLFVAVLSKESSLLDILFSDLSIDKNDLLKIFAGDFVWRKLQHEEAHSEKVEEKGKKHPMPTKTRTPLLDKFGRDLTRLAKEETHVRKMESR